MSRLFIGGVHHRLLCGAPVLFHSFNYSALQPPCHIHAVKLHKTNRPPNSLKSPDRSLPRLCRHPVLPPSSSFIHLKLPAPPLSLPQRHVRSVDAHVHAILGAGGHDRGVANAGVVIHGRHLEAQQQQRDDNARLEQRQMLAWEGEKGERQEAHFSIRAARRPPRCAPRQLRGPPIKGRKANSS